MSARVPIRTAVPTRLPLIGLLLIQAFIGYEWLNSGLTKIVRGGFPSGTSLLRSQFGPLLRSRFGVFMRSRFGKSTKESDNG